MTELREGMSRRQLLASGLVLAGAVALPRVGPGGGVAVAAPRPAERWWEGTSTNGWPVVDGGEVLRIEGSDVDVSLLPGDVSVVLLHVARRYHYEVDQLRVGEVLGHLTDRAVSQRYESNHLSGTAIAFRPNAYPAGVEGGLFPRQSDAVRHILAECRGVVRWGGDESTPKESHFEIAVPPGDARLVELAETVRQWSATPGQGAGVVNQSMARG